MPKAVVQYKHHAQIPPSPHSDASNDARDAVDELELALKRIEYATQTLEKVLSTIEPDQDDIPLDLIEYLNDQMAAHVCECSARFKKLSGVIFAQKPPAPAVG